MGRTYDDRRALAAAHFDGIAEIGDDLHGAEIDPPDSNEQNGAT